MCDTSVDGVSKERRRGRLRQLELVPGAKRCDVRGCIGGFYLEEKQCILVTRWRQHDYPDYLDYLRLVHADWIASLYS